MEFEIDFEKRNEQRKEMNKVNLSTLIWMIVHFLSPLSLSKWPNHTDAERCETTSVLFHVFCYNYFDKNYYWLFEYQFKNFNRKPGPKKKQKCGLDVAIYSVLLYQLSEIKLFLY